MFATLRLLNSYFWKTIYGPVLAFIFPIILLAIFGAVWRLEYVYPGIIALSILLLGVIALPLAIMELKSSSLFKYIGSSPVNPIKFTVVVIGFYIFIAIITGMIIFFGTMAIFPQKVFPDDGFKFGVLGGIFTLKGSFSFYLSALIHLVFVIATGLAIATFSRTPQQALTLALIIVLPTMFLSGMIVSVDIIATSSVLNWISRFVPYRYSTGNLIISATPVNQLESAISHWLRIPVDNSKPLSAILENGYPNNQFDQLIWPFAGAKPGVPGGPTFNPQKGYAGYLEWTKTNDPKAELEYKNASATEPTLYNILSANWRAMQLTSDNNVFDWSNDWGVKKLPQVDVLRDFLNSYFRGVDADGNVLPISDNNAKLIDRVATIGQQIQKGDYTWLNIFVERSNILYVPAERGLNVLLPLTLSGFGAWYTFKNFTWSVK